MLNFKGILVALFMVIIVSGCTTGEVSMGKDGLGPINHISKHESDNFMFGEESPYQLGAVISGKKDITQACLSYEATSAKEVQFIVKTGEVFNALGCQSLLSTISPLWSEDDQFEINYEVDENDSNPSVAFVDMIVKIEFISDR